MATVSITKLFPYRKVCDAGCKRVLPKGGVFAKGSRNNLGQGTLFCLATQVKQEFWFHCGYKRRIRLVTFLRESYDFAFNLQKCTPYLGGAKAGVFYEQLFKLFDLRVDLLAGQAGRCCAGW